MKIVCDNCSAKYSIADEKVAGKVFKIRCKKCTNVIVVRGDQIAAAEEEEAATQVFDYGSDQVWHVVVDGDQQGPYAPMQLGMMITEGTIDWEAYVWKEGFDGWKPARDVPELVTAISGEQPADDQGAAAAAGGAAAGAAAGGMGDDPFSGGGDPFAGGGEDAFAGGGAAAADPGADLFAGGGEVASPFGGDDDAGADEDVVASPSPRVSQEQAMTGARNENSVLFSLSNLQALATGGPSDGGGGASPAPMASSGPAPGHASGEGSGLIDIRALASATAATSSSSGGGAGGPADDLLSIGGSGGLGSSLGAPVLAPAAPEPEEGNKKMMLILGGVGILVVGLLVALIVVLTREPAPVAQAGAPGANTAGPGTPETPATAAAAGGTEAATENAGQPVTGTMTEEASDEGDEGEGDEGEADEGDDEGGSASGRRSRRARRGARGGSGGGSGGGSTAMSDPAPAMTSRMSNGSIDDLLDQAIGGGGSMMSAAMSSAMASNLPAQPSRDDVGRALRGVSGRVAGCGSGTAGVANASISFASSGRVRSVRVTGVPPAVQSCVSRGVRSARVPPFSRSSFSVNFPFRVR